MGVQGGPQLALIPTVAQYAHQASTLSKQVWLHAYDALQVEEVRLEVTMLITTRLGTASYVSLEDILTTVLARQGRRAAPSVPMVDIPLAQLVHARIALQVEEVRLEVAMLITTRLWTAPYVSLEDILTTVLARQGRRAAPSVPMVDIPLAQLVHARIALQVEEVRLEVAMLITTRLGTASYVSLENILTTAITR